MELGAVRCGAGRGRKEGRGQEGSVGGVSERRLGWSMGGMRLLALFDGCGVSLGAVVPEREPDWTGLATGDWRAGSGRPRGMGCSRGNSGVAIGRSGGERAHVRACGCETG